MTIRTALIGGISVLLLLSTVVLALVGVRAIREGVVREAQSRVDRDLFLFASLYEKELTLTADRLRNEVERLGAWAEAGVAGSEPDRTLLEQELEAAANRLGFVFLNLAATDGSRITQAGGPRVGDAVERDQEGGIERPDGRRGLLRDPETPELDPVLRSALQGVASQGTIVLTRERLRVEGGETLADRQRVLPPGNGPGGGTENALFHGYAAPLRDAKGTVIGAVYGGRPINHDEALVDELARTLFSDEFYEGKPVGTVTLFLGDTRVATNVRDGAGNRALGTQVSDVVREQVLDRGEPWHDRAWVVDSWYLSGYKPLVDPEGRTIGMLYVGLLEAPYDEMQTAAVRRFILPAIGLLIFAWIGTVFVVRRITLPLERIRRRADRITDGDWSETVNVGPSYAEVTSLSVAITNMQAAIRKRDLDLRSSNRELSRAIDELRRTNLELEETNTKLKVANENYMSTLGFVTHELRAPLANIQSLIDLVVEGHGGELHPAGRGMLVRVRKNCEELQGMVKDYLDLTRAERGGFAPRLREIEVGADVVEPCVLLSEGLLQSRAMRLEVVSASPIALQGDPELLRIALGNLLSNAAKYGREGGRVVLEVQPEPDSVGLEVWNEGEGFSAEESHLLFAKFSRLRNPNTKSRKGSGLGLFLTAQIVAEHGGSVSAESEPGQWARFGFRLPLGTADREAANGGSLQ